MEKLEKSVLKWRRKHELFGGREFHRIFWLPWIQTITRYCVTNRRPAATTAGSIVLGNLLINEIYTLDNAYLTWTLF